MLKTERNTKTMGARVLRAFCAWAKYALCADRKRASRYNSDFEHGQWWITDLDTGAQWSVCDAEGSEANGVFDGFCFEQVSRGEDL